MSTIKIVPESELRFGMASPAERALMFTTEPPEAAREAVDALERTHERYLQAVARVKEVDDAEASYHAAVRREIEQALAAEREPDEPPAPMDDFDAERRNRRTEAEARLAQVLAARRETDKAIEAAVGAQGAKDARRLPALYEETVEAVQAAQAALERLTEARRVAVQRMVAGDPHATARPVTGSTLDAAKALTIAEEWLTSRRLALSEPVITGPLEPSRREREQMAAAGGKYLEELSIIEHAEGFARTDFSRAYKHPSEVGPSGLSRGGTEVSGEDISLGGSDADVDALQRYVS